MLYLLYLPVLTTIILLYFRIAERLKIFDTPNHRSSHQSLTIRGGGIIFPIAILLHFFASGMQYPLFASGLFIISFISFYDDLSSLSNKIRFFAHFLAVLLLFMEANIIDQPMWVLCISCILIIGTINAYNFMDGINGITGGYSIVVLVSLFLVNKSINFMSAEIIGVAVISLIVFSIFNFRKKARCFAGDVGSVSIAYIIIFCLTLLIFSTENIKYLGFLLLYGLDTISTIIFRIVRREDIFKAHRSHFYQYLANSKNWSHLRISSTIAIVQIIINLWIIFLPMNLPYFILFLILCGIAFVCLRFAVEGKQYLLYKRY